MDTDEKPKMRKVKKQVRKGELPVSAGTASLDQSTKDKLAEQELAMISEDKLVADTEEKKNELETYIYDLRNKIDDQNAEFASDSEKTKLKEKLEAAEVCLRLSCSTCIVTNDA
jgi:heat shock protein 4